MDIDEEKQKFQTKNKEISKKQYIKILSNKYENGIKSKLIEYFQILFVFIFITILILFLIIFIKNFKNSNKYNINQFTYDQIKINTLFIKLIDSNLFSCIFCLIPLVEKIHPKLFSPINLFIFLLKLYSL